MPRFSLGLAAAAMLVLTACGSPGTPANSESAAPTPAPVTTTAAATPDATPDGTPEATPNGTATPDSTATPNGTATPRSTATPNSSATPTTQAVRELPARVDSFNRVEQETNDGVRVGVYRSADLNALVEVRLAQGTTARELITQLGGTNTTQVGDATCSSVGDTICAQERNNVTVAVSTKQLPASVVAGLTTKVLDGN